jgi:hypothetical protein
MIQFVKCSNMTLRRDSDRFRIYRMHILVSEKAV